MTATALAGAWSALRNSDRAGTFAQKKTRHWSVGGPKLSTTCVRAYNGRHPCTAGGGLRAIDGCPGRYIRPSGSWGELSLRSASPPFGDYTEGDGVNTTSRFTSYNESTSMRHRYPEIDVEKLLRLAAKLHLSNPALADAARIHLNVLYYTLRNGHPSHNTRRKLAKAVGLGDNDHELLKSPSPHDSSTAVQEVEEEVSSTIVATGALRDKDLQDQKIILASPRLSRRLLTGRKMPSMAECFLAGRSFTSASDRDKDHPADPRMAYNHFLQPSIVVVLTIDDGPNVVAYRREKRGQMPGHVHTVGHSILFASDPSFHTIGRAKSAFDEWLDATSKPKLAEKMLLDGPAPVLLKLVRDKIDLLKRKCRLHPLGIISNDQRTSKIHRVYSQFVFKVDVDVDDRNIDRFLRSISPDLRRVGRETDPEETFVGRESKKNHMDIVAWHALHSKRDTIRSGSAIFRRGIEIVQPRDD
jgi:hypothetical protein